MAARFYLILFLFIFFFFIHSSISLQPPTILNRTFIAEWEFQKRPWRGLNSTKPLLRHRMDAGYWSEPSNTPSGDWWLFGGKNFDKQYSDLWKFHGDTFQWERIYPKTDPGIVRSMVSPEKIPQPLLCGHHTPGRTVLAVFGPKLHTDTVWIYEVNDTLWTSYVCCCEKQNTKHTFCPNFANSKQHPVAWCDSANGAVLAVVPTSTTLQLWRFSLLTTRWEHVSMQITTPTTKTPFNCNLTDNNLLYTSADGLLYILCPDPDDVTKLRRFVYRYPNSEGEIEQLGVINLNILPQKISISAIRTTNGKIYLIIGYQQLIDIWLLNENTQTWMLLVNIWKGNALKWFQAISSNSGIYFLNIDGNYVMLSNPKLNEQKVEGVIQEQGIFSISISEDDGSILRGDYGMKKPITESTELTESSTVPSSTVSNSVPYSTTTEWSAELVMEGSPENISTCCWNLTETIVGNDRALLALSPQVNEVNRPLKAVASEEGVRKPDSYGALMFFVGTLSLFALGGVVMFVRKCVKWPERNSGTILKEPPPIRYSVIPDELAYPTYPTA